MSLTAPGRNIDGLGIEVCKKLGIDQSIALMELVAYKRRGYV